MVKKKVLVVFGTRPEAIKMFPVYSALLKRADVFEVKLCVTGQHLEMLHQVLELFEMFPDYDLSIMKKGQDLSDVTVSILLGLRNVLNEFEPDLLLVHGDTTTTLSASLAAFYKQIPVGHVEAGLRTHLRYSPWPEEMNRKLTTSLANLHFAPTESNRSNLLAEGVEPSSVLVTGNTVIDALLTIQGRLKKEDSLRNSVVCRLSELGLGEVLERVRQGERRLITVTGHRRENFGRGFENICKALQSIANRYEQIEIVYPVHLNPNVQGPVKSSLGDAKNIHLVPPVQYLEFVYLMMNSWLILTDSGGVQEEAPSLGIPVLVMRENTERPEAVDAGVVKLVGTEVERIVNGFEKLYHCESEYESMAQVANPYGNGTAGELIATAIQERFEEPY